jgi:hypothetical protein
MTAILDIRDPFKKVPPFLVIHPLEDMFHVTSDSFEGLLSFLEIILENNFLVSVSRLFTLTSRCCKLLFQSFQF